MRVCVLADDLTGANDTAAQFARAGFSAATVLSPDPSPWKGRYDVLALTTESRGISPGVARARCREAVERLRPRAGEIVYKKVDSALRGNPGAEIEGVLRALGPGAVGVLAPAFPANGRTTEDGRQLINGVPVDRSAMANDPLAPVRQSYVPELVRAQADLAVERISVAEVELGPAHLRGRIEELRRRGARVIVVDAVRDEHLDAIAAALLAVERAVPCGSAGLGGAIARVLASSKAPGVGAAGSGGAGREWGVPEEQGEASGIRRPLLGVIGSKSEAARAQVETARRLLPDAEWVAVPPGALARAGAALLARASTPAPRSTGAPAGAVASGREATGLGEAAESAARALHAGRDAVLYVEPGGEANPRAIAAGLGELAAEVVGMAAPAALYLTGGDTARSVFDRLGVEAVEVHSELAPGVCLGRAHGGAAGGLELVTKAGSFGDPYTLYRLMASRRGGGRRGPGEESHSAERN